MKRSGFWRCRRGSTAVEFALVAPTLFLLTIGGTLFLSQMFWTRGGLESVAALTARCGATGYALGTTSCTTGDTTKAYAVAAANTWVMANVISTSDVTVSAAAVSCNGAGGKFFVVTIRSTYFASLPPPFGNFTLSVTACYPQA